MPVPQNLSYIGVGLEATKATAQAATDYLALTKFDPEDQVVFLDDMGWRGSNVDNYGSVDGPRQAAIAMSGDWFSDTSGYLLAGLLGDVSYTVGPTSTTLSSSASAAATTISTAATIAVGSIIQIDTLASGVAEVRVTTAVSGAGPYTVTVPALTYAHSSSAPVTCANRHVMSVLNSGDMQSKGLTFTDYDGIDYRQYAGAQISDLSLKFAAGDSLSFDANAVASPSVTTTAPTRSYSAVQKIPGWRGVVTLGGSVDARVMSGNLDIKRPVTATPTVQGSASPYAIFQGAVSVSGALSIIAETAQLEYLQFLARTTTSGSLSFLNPGTTLPTGLVLAMSQFKYRTGKINRGQDYVSFDLNFTAEGNATDVGSSGGYGQIKATVGCAKTTGTFQ